MRYSFESFSKAAEPAFFSGTEAFQPLFSSTFSEEDSKAVCEEKGSSPPVSQEDAVSSENGAAPGEEKLQHMLQESYEKGLADGQKHTDELFKNSCRSLSSAVIEISELKEKIIRESEEDLLRLAILVAKQIIQQEISQDREILAQFVADATKGITDQDEIIISFNPEDCRIVSEKRHLYLAGLGDKRQVTIKPDDSVPVGGCIVDMPTGLVDARIEAQLEELYRQLMQERGFHGDDTRAFQIAPKPIAPDQYGVENYGFSRN